MESKMNADAAEFRPNVMAAEFVPSWLKQDVEPEPRVVKAEAVSEAKPEAKEAKPEPKPEVKEAKKEAKAEPKILPRIDTEIDEETQFELYGKEHVNLVFIGHVDAGKSTTGGNLLFLTGMVDKRTMEKYEKEAREQNRESWYLSWALDTNAEERKKGKTVECGKAYFETDKRRYTILDAPGHKSYVPNMIGGASQADVGVLVISARKGEFETGFERGGQTREHAVLAKTNGVNRLVVAINKMDDATVKWSQTRYNDIVSKLVPFLKGTGYNPKTDIEFIPISGYTGANLKDRGGCDWYKGPSLLEYLDAMELLDRKKGGPLVLPINAKYKEMGTMISGKIESGRVRKGQTIVIMPNRLNAEVTGIYIEDEEQEGAVCGDNVRLRLKGIEEEEVMVGFVATTGGLAAVSAFEAQLAILEHRNIICAGYNAVMHVHAATEEANLGKLLHLIDKKTGKKTKRAPQFVKKGQQAIVVVELAQPVVVAPFEDQPQLGRFTLRDEGKTVAIGNVTKLLF